MLSVLRLLLPALIPSWRFFQSIEPSPRLQWRPAPFTGAWQAFRPRPRAIARAEMAKRLLWNPVWNESLFLVTLSERLIREDCDFAKGEIARRMGIDLGYGSQPEGFQFRIVFVTRELEQLQEHVLFTSAPIPHVTGSGRHEP